MGMSSFNLIKPSPKNNKLHLQEYNSEKCGEKTHKKLILMIECSVNNDGYDKKSESVKYLNSVPYLVL